MAASVVAPPRGQPSDLKHATAKAQCCPTCGGDSARGASDENAQRRIRDLEAEVEMLKEKATAAVDKCADFEDQLRNAITNPVANARHQPLRSQTLDSHLASTSLAAPSFAEEPSRPSSASSLVSSRTSRFSFLTSVRRQSPAQLTAPLAPAQPTTPGAPLLASPLPSTSQLEEQLAHERKLRTKAEERVHKADSEIEELSVQLFSQANEMVATERRARAKLEARIEVLEKKDRDKAARLERLEKAVWRLERVKAMLTAPATVQTGTTVRNV